MKENYSGVNIKGNMCIFLPSTKKVPNKAKIIIKPKKLLGPRSLGMEKSGTVDKNLYSLYTRIY
jgi:hypothetical protein